MKEYKVGDIVRWCWTETHPNTYIIIGLEYDKNGQRCAVLKQNFGLNTVLAKLVPLTEFDINLSKVRQHTLEQILE